MIPKFSVLQVLQSIMYFFIFQNSCRYYVVVYDSTCGVPLRYAQGLVLFYLDST